METSKTRIVALLRYSPELAWALLVLFAYLFFPHMLQNVGRMVYEIDKLLLYGVIVGLMSAALACFYRILRPSVSEEEKKTFYKWPLYDQFDQFAKITFGFVAIGAAGMLLVVFTSDRLFLSPLGALAGLFLGWEIIGLIILFFADLQLHRILEND